MKNFLSRLSTFIPEVWRHFSKGKYLWLCLGVIAGAFALSLLVWPNEKLVRFTGFGLQLLGMIVAVINVLDVRNQFQMPFVRKLVIDWLRGFPRWKREYILEAGAGRFSFTGGNARCKIRNSDDPSKPIEERIDSIVRNVELIDQDLDGLHASYEKLNASHKKHQSEVEIKLNNRDEKIRSDLKSLHTGDYQPALVGLCWLIVGSLMSTMSIELCEIFARLGWTVCENMP